MSNSTDSSLKGKRKKKLPSNANPLFTQWLTEWKNEAVEKGWKSAHTYSKALQTLKKFPLPLESGKDCRLLQNFGEKICKMLDEKLIEYKRQGISGTVPNSSAAVTHFTDVDEEIQPQNNLVTRKKIILPSSKEGRPPVVNKPQEVISTKFQGPNIISKVYAHSLHQISDNSDSEAEISPPPKKKPARSKGKDYVPAFRSGAYALILTLYKYMQDPEFKGYLTKSELSHAAQPLADKSFTKPDPDNRYTAWSSMGTLIKKGYIIKSNSPARYSLTDAGHALGEKLDRAENGEIAETNGSKNVSGDQRFCSEIIQVSRSSEILNSGPENSEPIHDTEAFSVNNGYGSEDDEEFKRAISESLLSYSLELSLNSGTSTSVMRKNGSDLDHPFASNKVEGVVGGQINHDDVFIISDDENDLVPNDVPITSVGCVTPVKAHQRVHALSPSPPVYRTSTLQPSIDTKLTITANQQQHTNGKLLLNGNHIDEIEVLSDSDDVIPKQRECISTDFDDELPDLDLPLFKRLLQKGTIQSNLLRVHEIDDNDKQSSNKLASSLNTIKSTENQINNSELKVKTSNLKEHSKCVESSNSCSVTNKHLTSKETSINLLCEAHVNPVCSKKAISSNTVQFKSVPQPKDISNNIAQLKFTSVSQHAKQPVVVQTHVSSDKCFTELRPQLTPEFSLYPGTFDIILCLDNREFYGSKSSSKTLLPDLMKSGVQCDLRLLHVGDLLWIARERVGPQINGTQGRELVLNYIIERKRLDDLVSSITDGRLKEQKFRLKHCGLQEKIILIEEYGSIKNFSISEERIKQSIFNSQVIDGFKVKNCAGSQEAVTYLTIMTQFLKLHFSNKTLHAVSLDALKTIDGKQLIKNKEHYLIPFSVFNEASVKHKDLTVKEMFAKQLIQIPGVSADRARSITSIYPTLSLLLEAYEKCASDKDKEKLLSCIKCGKTQRNLGTCISRVLYLLYTEKNSLS